MKRMFLSIITILLVFFTIPVTSDAETKYVSGVMQITMRTGPGTGNKIIKMIKSGQAMNIIQSEEGWSLVRLPDGKEGWVLNHLIKSEKPKILLFDNLEKKYNRILKSITDIKDKNSKLLLEKETLVTEYQEKNKSFNEVSQLYNSLKERSARLLTLESKFKKADELLEKRTAINELLEKELASKNIEWFLYGAGVFLAGFVLGFSTRRKPRRSSLN